jgi:capsular polysaccharide biosynthesis protein
MDTLQSPEVLESAAPFNARDALKSFVEVIRSRQLLVLSTLLIGLIIEGVMLVVIPRTYEASARLLTVGAADGRDSSVSTVDLPSVATSTVVLSRALDDLKLPLTVIDLKKTLKAHVSDRSSIMDITYENVSPDRAVSVPNAVADELVTYYRSISTNRASNDVQRLDAALGETRDRMTKVNGQLGALTAQYPFLGADKPLNSLSDQLDTLETQRALATATLTGDEAAAAAAVPGSKAMSLIARHEILASDPLYTQLVAGSSKDGAQLAFDESTYSDRYPELRILRQKVQAERAHVQREAQQKLSSADAFSPSQAQSVLDNGKAMALVAGDRSRVTEINNLIGRTRAELQEYRAASARYSWLSVQRDAAAADYLGLSSRRTQAVANRAESLSLGSLFVVDRAVLANTTVVGFGRTHLAIVMTLIVVLLAICIAPIAEMLDPRLRRAEQIEQLYGSTLITTLGH